MNKISLTTTIWMLFSIFACDLEQEIEINLPDYEIRPVVECYLIPGESFSLLLSRSVAYFDPFLNVDDDAFVEQFLENDAEVTVTHNGKTYTLKNQLTFNPFTKKVFNYSSNERVPLNYDHDFKLNIITKSGKTIEATTRILPKVPIDSVVVEFAEKDTLARILTYFTDNPNEKNYYRRLLNIANLDSIPEQDFVADDRFVDNNLIVFGTGYDYSEGDTVFNTIFHIDKAYFDFLESLARAQISNGNPFSQPSPIISNVTGTANAIGIFTFLSFDRVATIVKK